MPANNAATPAPLLPVSPTATGGTANISQTHGGGVSKGPKPGVDESKMRPVPGASEVAAQYKPAVPSSLAASENAQPETDTSAPNEKLQSINLAKRLALDEKDLDHLSAPPSQIHSGTASPAPELAEGIGSDSAAKSHRGSEVTEAPPEEIKKVESETAIPEAEDEGESTAKDVQGEQVGEGKTVQEQSAKEPDDATKSVED